MAGGNVKIFSLATVLILLKDALLPRNAHGEERTVVTTGVAGHAPVAAPKDHAVVGIQPLFPGDGGLETPFNCQDGCLRRNHG